MSGKFGRVLGMVMVLSLVVMAGGFLIGLLEAMGNEGFEFVIVGVAGLGGLAWLVLRGPVGKALASMLEGDRGEDEMLSLRVADLEDRLQEVALETQRFLEIEERLEFTERLLAQHTDPARRLEAQ